MTASNAEFLNLLVTVVKWCFYAWLAFSALWLAGGALYGVLYVIAGMGQEVLRMVGFEVVDTGGGQYEFKRCTKQEASK